MSLNKQVREKTIMACSTDVAGAVTQGENLTNGASGTGSCTLSDTSLYTYAYSRTFARIPQVIVTVTTADARELVAHVTDGTGRYSGCTIRGKAYNGAGNLAIAHQLMVIGQ